MLLPLEVASASTAQAALPSFSTVATSTLTVVIMLAILTAGVGAAATRWFRAGRTAVAALALGLLVTFGFVAIPFMLRGNAAWIDVELIAIGLLIVGGFFGFLFGLPTVIQSNATSADTAQPLLGVNTHLEEVTAKIATLLTGVALAQLLTVPHYVSDFNSALVKLLAINNGAPGSAIGIALMLYFPPLGFVISYIIMRVQVSEWFAQADERLQQFGSGQQQIWRAPPLPDISDGASGEQLGAARSVASIPYGMLTDPDQKATWARANALLGNYLVAEQAYQDVRVLNPRDYHAIIDYATVLYNDPQIDDIPQVISLLNAAEQLCPQTNLDALSRLKVLRAAAYLYQAGGYESAIREVNSLLATPNMPQPKLTRYYRACGFGQLFWAIQSSGGLSQESNSAIERIILNDAALTLAQGSIGRSQLLLVANGDGRQNPADNDLQDFTVADAAFRAQLQITAPPPPQPPAPPVPTTITDGAIAGGWITLNCPP